MKKFNLFIGVLILLALFVASKAGAQVDVISTGGTFSASYTTLKGAFDAINAGTHTGTITIGISNNTTETAPAVLNASGSGSASYTSITISPTGGTARTISGAIAAGSPLIDLKGADNVTFNGLNTGGNSLTISNTTASTSSGTSTIRFIDGATNNTVTNCTVLGSFSAAVSTNGGNIFFSTDGSTTNGNDNNTISYCNIGPAGSNLPTKCIFGNGSQTTTAIGNSGNTISNNNIYDYFGAAVASAGIYIANGCNTWSITNNKLYQTATRTWTTGAQHSAIWILSSTATYGAQGFTITGNTIGYASSSGTGTYTLTGSTGKFSGIYFNGITSGTVSDISSNTIASVSLTGVTSSGTSTSSPFAGIIVSNGVANTNSNIIGSQSATGSLTFSTNTTSAAEVFGLFNFSVNAWTANNNQIGGINTTNAGATGTFIFYGIRANTGSSYTVTANNNLIGGTVANSILHTSSSTTAQLYGMLTNNAAATFTSNTIRNLTATGGTGTGSSSSVIGIGIAASSANHTVSQNNIYNLSNTNTTAAVWINGINFYSSTGTNLISRNLIHSFNIVSSSTSAQMNGIYTLGGTATYQNNMIRLGIDGSGSSISAGCVINGIYDGIGTNNFYFNSVYLGGTVASGGSNTYAFNSAVTINTRVFENNIFYNARSGGSAFHYAIQLAGISTPILGLTCDYNLLYAPAANGRVGRFNSADRTNLTAWQSGTNQDAHSCSADPQFIAPTGTSSTLDLHINASSPTIVEANGLAIGSVTDDYDGQTRSGLTPTDIGADAGNFTPFGVANPSGFTASVISSQQINLSFTPNLSNNNVVIVWNNTGTFSTPSGAPPSVGGSLAGGTLIYNGTTSPFNHTDLTQNIQYFYKAFSYDGANYSTGMTANGTTYGVPNIAVISSPANASTNIALTQTLNWTSGGGNPSATGYKMYFGTNNPPTNIVNGTDLGNVLTYSPTLSYSTTYYWRIQPYNAYGDQTGGTVWSFTTMADPSISSFPWTESFDNTTFPPNASWTNLKTAGSGTGTWDRQTSGTYPTCSPHSGAGMSRYYCFNYASGTKGILGTPPINFPGDDYRVKFWFYRDATSSYLSTADLVNVYYNTANNLTGATLLGTINRSISLSPVVGTAGWYEYTFNMPAGAGGNGKYVIFEGVSAYGDNIFLDDITLEQIPSTPILTSSTLSGFGNVCINTTAGPNSFTLTGTNLSPENISIGELTGFSYSTTSGGTYSNSLSLSQPGGSFSQTIYVKFNPTLVQSYNGNIPVNGGGAPALNVAATGSGINTASTVTTPTSGSITMNSALLGGNITNIGCSNVTERGIYYSTTSGFTPPGEGTKVSETGTFGTGAFTVQVNGLNPSTTYFYKAFATNDAGQTFSTQGSFSTLCDVATIPYTQNFESVTVPAIPNCCSIQNAGTGNNWTTSSAPGNGFTSKTLQYSYHSSNNANAWFYTQGLNLSGGTSYRLTFKYGNNSATTYSEKLKVWYGTSAINTSMTNAIVDYPSITGGVQQISTTDFIISSSGTYYIGFNCYSAFDQYNLYVDDITLDVTPTTPVFSITPTTKNFGNISANGGSSSQLFTITNTGGGTLTINDGGISITGANIDQFNLNTVTYPIQLTNGQSATVTVNFVPTVTGLQNANLSIIDNIAKSNHDIALSGTGVLNAPQTLSATLQTGTYYPVLSWLAPMSPFQMKGDDGTVEKFGTFFDVSSSSQMFSKRFICGTEGELSQIALFAKSNSISKLNKIFICPDNGNNEPDLSNTLATIQDIAIEQTAKWYFAKLAVPLSFKAGSKFFVVGQMADGTGSVYIGLDNNEENTGNLITNDNGVKWAPYLENFTMRVFMKSGSEQFISGEATSETKNIPVEYFFNTSKLKEEKEQKSEINNKTNGIQLPYISSLSGTKILNNYTLYRGTTTGTYDMNFPGITSTTYTDNSAILETKYYYAVKALYTNGESGYSNEVNITPANPNYGTFSTGSGLYKFSNSTAYGKPGDKPTYEWIPTTDFTTISTWTSGSADDGYFSATMSGHFLFFGTDYTSVFIGSNGYITFGLGSTNRNVYQLPSTSAPFNMIAPALMDLDASTSYYPDTKISYKDFGDKFVISFEKVRKYLYGGGSTNYISFQIILYISAAVPSTNSLYIINYNDDLTSAPLSTNTIVTGASVGINGPGGTIGYSYRYAGAKGPIFDGISKGAYAMALGYVDYNSPLPVKLASFTSSVNKRDVNLKWVTNSEMNNAGFEIERAIVSNQQLEFSKIAFVSGKGNSNVATNYEFNDSKLNTGKYKYRLKQIDNNGNFEYHELDGFVEIGIPTKFDMSQNYPNPFNPVTKIDFDLPYDTKVSIKIFDMLGREVKTLVNEFHSSGYYTILFDASALTSGVYFYRIMTEGGKFVMTKKLVIIK